ncbi:MAG: polysaccharide deacetylase family protein [Lachnospiraceae bacterium]|nr:polysaccharide deacetylase family protein [Butyrivibrio sp.]MCM1344651.1 polysaccharide deacetylase family protein [Muribaculaceae bacterium]MCM1411213.1 polysaccharide deacetylase family protein [Lachnospiraceae bacterium]
MKKRGIKWKSAGILLLAVLLTACGGEQADKGGALPSGAVGVEDLAQSMPGQTGTDDSSQAADDQASQAGDAQGGTGLDPSASGQAGIGSSAQSGSVSEPAVPVIPMEPFEEKLTPEGVGWGLGFGESGTQPTGVASPQEMVQYDAYFLNPGEEKVIYLTFDCGYENGNTEKILDALKAHDAPATFFVVGHFLETEPELVQRMVEEGHAVGNHTYHHYDVDTLDEESFRKELEDVETLFNEITGAGLSPYYRPPEGKCGTTNLKRAQELGYATCFWSLAYVDWDTDHQPTHQAALDKLTSRIHPGAVVLLHNTSSTNGEILDELLTKWEAMGYRFAPLSELTQK